MGTIFVARSKALSQWGYDVGLSKNIFKVGYTDGDVKSVIAAGWAGETDWALVKKEDGIEGSEEAIIARLTAKVKMVDPRLNPRIKDTQGIFKVTPTQVENHLMIVAALAGEPEIKDIKLKPADYATYLIVSGLG